MVKMPGFWKHPSWLVCQAYVINCYFLNPKSLDLVNHPSRNPWERQGKLPSTDDAISVLLEQGQGLKKGGFSLGTAFLLTESGGG